MTGDDLKRVVWPISVVVLLIAFKLSPVRHPRKGRADTMEYRGEQFKMRKAYSSYEAYKDDSDNLDTNELERIERTIVAVPFPASFTSREDFIHAIFKLRFPGYGLAGIAAQTDDGSALFVESVEVPQRDKDRYVAVHESKGQFVLIDDFVFAAGSNAITRVSLERGKLSYFDSSGSVVRAKDLEVK